MANNPTSHIHQYVGIPAVGEHIDDHGPRGYGHLNVRQFKNNPINRPVINADNYRVYAQELFWSLMCVEEYKDPTDNIAYPGLVHANQHPPSRARLAQPTPSRAAGPPSAPRPQVSSAPVLPVGGKAISIIFQQSLDQSGALTNSWLIFGINHGQSAVCWDPESAKAQKVTGGDHTTIDNPPWPGGEGDMEIKDLDGMDCQYKNRGLNPGRLWCGERQFECKEDNGKAEGRIATQSCAKGHVMHHPVVYCEWKGPRTH
jgi:hypothetical protein